MYPPRAARLVLALLLCLGAQPLPAQEDDDGGGGALNPLSAPDQARIEQLLQGFDPNSFDLKTQFQAPDGRIQTRAVGRAGLASLQQLETERPAGAEAARTQTVINVFSQARTQTVINVFREAAAARTETVINIFKDEGQQARAMEINSILQKYVSAPAGPTAAAPTGRLRRGEVTGRERPAAGVVFLGAGPQLNRPLSGPDQARVEQLLQAFDPNSYSLTTQVANPDGSVQTRALGDPKGLASLQQLETQRSGEAGVAQSKTVINIFREAARNAMQEQSAMEINAILQKYTSGP
jgi:hypothetical protein